MADLADYHSNSRIDHCIARAENSLLNGSERFAEIPTGFRRWLYHRMLSHYKLEPLTDEQKRQVLPHELGHALSNYALGLSAQELTLMQGRSIGAHVYSFHSYNPKQVRDVLQFLLTATAGYAFEEHLYSPRPTRADTERLQRNLIFVSAIDINQMREKLREARQLGTLRLPPGTDLEPLDVERLYQLIQRHREARQILTGEEKKFIARTYRALQQTLEYPYIQEALSISREMARSLNPKQRYLKLVEDCLPYSVIDEKTLNVLLKKHMGDAGIRRLQFIAEGIFEAHNPDHIYYKA
ncbi:MAG: hypothetical protein VKJ04_11105 [Vampirovibrionales bacterium]|nr:hypothetical protein [Vampirovibrionales bacterium]